MDCTSWRSEESTDEVRPGAPVAPCLIESESEIVRASESESESERECERVSESLCER